MKHAKRLLFAGSLTCGALLLSACGGDSDSHRRFEVSITNLTHNQPLSPPLVAIHNADVHAWNIGQPASAGLELLAESGDGSALSSELRAADAHVALSDAVLVPGASETFLVRSNPRSGAHLSMASMLVNTNDAFAGLQGMDLSALERGDTIKVQVPAHDAGTEANTEDALTVPGPAGGGEGFNAAREARDAVSLHGGVVTQADGLTGSALDESHRFDNPVVLISVTRY